MNEIEILTSRPPYPRLLFYHTSPLSSSFILPLVVGGGGGQGRDKGGGSGGGGSGGSVGMNGREDKSIGIDTLISARNFLTILEERKFTYHVILVVECIRLDGQSSDHGPEISHG